MIINAIIKIMNNTMIEYNYWIYTWWTLLHIYLIVLSLLTLQNRCPPPQYYSSIIFILFSGFLTMHGLYLIVAKGGLRGFNGDGKRSSEGGGGLHGGICGIRNYILGGFIRKTSGCFPLKNVNSKINFA